MYTTDLVQTVLVDLFILFMCIYFVYIFMPFWLVFLRQNKILLLLLIEIKLLFLLHFEGCLSNDSVKLIFLKHTDENGLNLGSNSL